MRGRPLARHCAAIHACIAAIAVAGCGMAEPEPAPCRAGMPAQGELLRAPAFASLEYHRRTNFDVSRGAGADLWADSKFDFKSGVEYSLVPAKNAASGARYCADALSIKLALPLDERRREMLRAFVQAAGSGTALRPAAVQARVDEALAQRSKYRAVASAGGVSAEAGTVTHPTRGDLFVVAFIWQ